MIALRSYQNECLESSLAGFNRFRKQLVVAPTGAGKAIIMAHLAKAFVPRRTLMLCHREELVAQAAQKLHKATGIFAQVEKAEERASLSAEVVVASVQTMQGARLGKWPQNHFALVICDEAHHVTSPSWQATLRHFDAHAKVWGCTATPDRADRKNLGSYFEDVAFEIQLFDLIHQGFLSPIKVKALPLNIDLNEVKKVGGDYSAEDLDAAIAPYLRATAQAIAEHAAFRKTLVFLPLIQTSKDFVRECEAAGLNAAHIDGTSPDRKEILARFASGEIDILSNAMLLTEGYDEPSIDCVVVLRPTRSRALYSQMVGRGTRIAPAKRDLLLLDFLWLHKTLDLIRPANLIASSKAEADAISARTEAEALEQTEFDLEELQVQISRDREEALRRAIDAKAARHARNIDPIAFCLSIHNLQAAEYEPSMPWEREPASEKQITVLRNMGIATDAITKGHATRLLNIVFTRRKLKLATPKQLKFLRQFGHPSPETCSSDEAKKFLDGKWGRSLLKKSGSSVCERGGCNDEVHHVPRGAKSEQLHSVLAQPEPQRGCKRVAPGRAPGDHPGFNSPQKSFPLSIPMERGTQGERSSNFKKAPAKTCRRTF